MQNASLNAVFDACVDQLRMTVASLVGQQEFEPVASQLRDVLQREIALGSAHPGQAFFINNAEHRIEFDAQTIYDVTTLARKISQRINGNDATALFGIMRACVIEYVAHELIHWVQGFPDYRQVAGIRSGMGDGGIAQLDVAADTAAARIAARVDGLVFGKDALTAKERYVNALTLSYALTTELFPIGRKRPKKQRAVGLLMATSLAQADVLGALNRSNLCGCWHAERALLAFDPVADASLFNALVIDSTPSILIPSTYAARAKLNLEIWDEIGVAPPALQLARVTRLFVDADIIDEDALLDATSTDETG